MDIYLAPNYREFMAATMRAEDGKSRGAVKRIAEVLKCHSTYVSQIINGKSDLSTEQAIALCLFFKMDRAATEHFLDLVGFEKAGTPESRDYFQERIEGRKSERLDLKKRLNASSTLSVDQEALYYNGWLPQVVHICTQLEAAHTAKSIAAILKIDVDKVTAILADLETVGLVEQIDGQVRCIKASVHLSKESPTISRFHSNWRLKTIHEMMTTAKLPGMHYSSVLTMSAKTAAEVRELVIRHLNETRAVIIPSPSEHIYAYCLDFYPITDDGSKQS